LEEFLFVAQRGHQHEVSHPADVEQFLRDVFGNTGRSWVISKISVSILTDSISLTCGQENRLLIRRMTKLLAVQTSSESATSNWCPIEAGQDDETSSHL
jgi:hypothetical protein